MIVFPAQVLASVEHILQFLVGCIIDLSSEHLLVFCHLSLFFSLCLFDCAEDSSHSASFRSSSVPLPYLLGGRCRSMGERGNDTKVRQFAGICLMCLSIFRLLGWREDLEEGNSHFGYCGAGGRSIAHCKYLDFTFLPFYLLGRTEQSNHFSTFLTVNLSLGDALTKSGEIYYFERTLEI